MTDSELKQVLDESEVFWRQVAIDNHRIPADRLKRPRPECLCDKPHLRYQNGKWLCACYLKLTSEYLLSGGWTSQEALDHMRAMINRHLDWDRINQADFIYIDFVLIYCPPIVFNLLPSAIQHAYA